MKILGVIVDGKDIPDKDYVDALVKNPFWCTYGTTTYAEIEAALTADRIPVLMDNTRLYVYYRTGGSTPSHEFTAAGQNKVFQLKCASSDSSWSRENTSIAPLNSPSLTGEPTAPTATAGTNTTQIATTAFVATAIANAITDAIGGSY